MPSRITTTQVRTPGVPAQTPAKPKPAAQTTPTGATGWATGSKPVTSLKITAARIDEGLPTLKKIAVPKGYTAELKDLSSNASDKVHGTKVSIEQTDQQLTLTNAAGKKFTIGTPADMETTLADWKDGVKAAKAEPKDEFMMLDWSSSHTTSGVGTAGKLFSVSDSYSSFTGGAHPSSGTGISTWDASTGKQVTLDSLLTQQQMNNLVKDVHARLGKLKGPEEVDGRSFELDGDRASIREAINSNFALTTDKHGKVQIQIAWESGVHALGPLSAHFTVDAPADAAFKAKVGLE